MESTVTHMGGRYIIYNAPTASQHRSQYRQGNGEGVNLRPTIDLPPGALRTMDLQTLKSGSVLQDTTHVSVSHDFHC
jgi:hypothetical protein